MTSQECIFGPDIRKSFDKRRNDENNKKINKRMFVVSPFGYPYEFLYNEIIYKFNVPLKKNNRAGTNIPCNKYDQFYITRADRATQLGFVMCQKICKEIRLADYVLVDLSEPNPNVFYELGLAMGFGKRILFVFTSQNRLNYKFGTPWQSFLNSREVKLKTYKDFERLLKNKTKLKDIINYLNNNVFNSYNEIQEMKDPSTYIGRDNNSRKKNRKLLFCHSTPNSDENLLIEAAKESIKKWKWTIKPKDIARGFDVDSIINILKYCKISMVDVSNYTDTINPNTFWLLGISHALGRDSIPVTNRSKSKEYTPFDIRGLYQIYFESLDGFKESLKNIVEVIDAEYRKEIAEYPQLFLWNNILRGNNDVVVFTYGRGSKGDPKRDGGRTNVDRWDYQAVGTLSFFLAQKFKQASVQIRPPEDTRAGKTKQEINDRIKYIENNLKAGKNYIIIGSPDVSDYAEIVLSKAYNIAPYKQLKCDEPDCKRTECKRDCVGRRGYIFAKNKYFSGKKNKRGFHPRSKSFCYRDAIDVNQQYVLWYGDRHRCSEDTTYGVITIFYKNPLQSENNNANKKNNCSIIVLSGFSGIATYGLSVLLSGQNEQQAEYLLNIIRNYENVSAIQILVKIKYDTDLGIDSHEARNLNNIEVQDVELLNF
jgi:hypothetical protein